jgi:flagellar basal body rod protein FlgG
MRAMVELIEASRYFEAYQKTMQSSDEMDAKLIRMGE